MNYLLLVGSGLYLTKHQLVWAEIGWGKKPMNKKVKIGSRGGTFTITDKYYKGVEVIPPCTSAWQLAHTRIHFLASFLALFIPV